MSNKEQSSPLSTDINELLKCADNYLKTVPTPIFDYPSTSNELLDNYSYRVCNNGEEKSQAFKSLPLSTNHKWLGSQNRVSLLDTTQNSIAFELKTKSFQMRSSDDLMGQKDFDNSQIKRINSDDLLMFPTEDKSKLMNKGLISNFCTVKIVDFKSNHEFQPSHEIYLFNADTLCLSKRNKNYLLDDTIKNACLPFNKIRLKQINSRRLRISSSLVLSVPGLQPLGVGSVTGQLDHKNFYVLFESEAICRSWNSVINSHMNSPPSSPVHSEPVTNGFSRKTITQDLRKIFLQRTISGSGNLLGSSSSSLIGPPVGDNRLNITKICDKGYLSINACLLHSFRSDQSQWVPFVPWLIMEVLEKFYAGTPGLYRLSSRRDDLRAQLEILRKPLAEYSLVDVRRLFAHPKDLANLLKNLLHDFQPELLPRCILDELISCVKSTSTSTHISADRVKFQLNQLACGKLPSAIANSFISLEPNNEFCEEPNNSGCGIPIKFRYISVYHFLRRIAKHISLLQRFTGAQCLDLNGFSTMLTVNLHKSSNQDEVTRMNSLMSALAAQYSWYFDDDLPDKTTFFLGENNNLLENSKSLQQAVDFAECAIRNAIELNFDQLMLLHTPTTQNYSVTEVNIDNLVAERIAKLGIRPYMDDLVAVPRRLRNKPELERSSSVPEVALNDSTISKLSREEFCDSVRELCTNFLEDPNLLLQRLNSILPSSNQINFDVDISEVDHRIEELLNQFTDTSDELLNKIRYVITNFSANDSLY